MSGTSEEYPSRYEYPATLAWDAEKMGQALDILGLDGRRADGLIYFEISKGRVTIERLIDTRGGTTRHVILFV